MRTSAPRISVELLSSLMMKGVHQADCAEIQSENILFISCAWGGAEQNAIRDFYPSTVPLASGRAQPAFHSPRDALMGGLPYLRAGTPEDDLPGDMQFMLAAALSQ